MCTCADHIVANRVTDILETNGIAFRLHDETADMRPGTYGSVPGIAIYVFDKDHEMAAALVEPVTGNNTQYVGPYCLKFRMIGASNHRLPTMSRWRSCCRHLS